MRIALLLLVLSLSVHAETVIKLQDTEGNWLDGETSFELTDPEINYDFSYMNEDSIVIYEESGFRFEFRRSDDFPLERRMFIGATSPWGFNQGQAKMTFQLPNPMAHCFDYSSEFRIWEVDFEEPFVLALDFGIKCKNWSGTLKGQIRINSDWEAPLSSPILTIDTEKTPFLPGKSVKASINDAYIYHPITHIQWSQTRGPSVTFDNPNGLSTNVTLPNDIKLGGESVWIAAEIYDSNGGQHKNDKRLHVASKSDPQTHIKVSFDRDEDDEHDRDWLYYPGNAHVTIGRDRFVGVNIYADPSVDSPWNFDFAHPQEAHFLAEGTTYENGRYYPYQDHTTPQLRIIGENGYCTNSMGSFEVQRIQYDSDLISLVPNSFRTSFSMRCNGSNPYSLTGEVSYNATHPSVPKAKATAESTVNEKEVAELHSNASTDPEDDIVSYEWSTKEYGIVISDADQPTASFTAPALSDRRAYRDVKVRLLVRDREGYENADEISVRILENNQKPIANDDYYEVIAGETVKLHVLDNDSDPDGQLIAEDLGLSSSTIHGRTTKLSNGVLEYTAFNKPGFEDGLKYRISDNDSAVSTANVYIKILPKPEEPAPEEPAPEEPAPEEPAPEEPAPEEPAPEEPASEEPASEEPASEEPTPEQPAPEQPAPEEPTPEQPAPEEPTPEQPTPEQPAPEEPTPEEPTPEQPAPEQPAPEATDSEQEAQSDSSGGGGSLGWFLAMFGLIGLRIRRSKLSLNEASGS